MIDGWGISDSFQKGFLYFMDYPMDIDDHRSGFCWHICVTFNSWYHSNNIMYIDGYIDDIL